MELAIKIKDLVGIDDTAASVLRVIALHVADQPSAFVGYSLIAKSLNLERATVAKAVERLKQKRIVSVKDGGLAIEKAILLD
ncbi:MAG: hypothetical protein IJD33_01940 [Clostridia bacterium]|nr:hypothetical protein [Clostridia bacterium]